MKKIFILPFILFISIQSFADTYFVSPVTGVSVEESLRLSVYDLMISNLKELNLQVIKEQNQAVFTIETQLTKLGSAYIVTTQKNSNGKSLLSKKMKIASVDEMDKAIQRLARSLVSEKDPAQEVRVGEVTNEEQTKISKRMESFDYRTFSLGVSQFSNLKSAEKDVPNIYLGTGYQFDVTEQSFIKIIADFSWRQSAAWATMWNVGLGYGYYFQNAMYSPFVSFDLGYGGALCSNLDSESGITLGAQLGYGMFRASHKQLNLSVRYLQLFKSNQEGNPSLLGFMLSALF